MLFTTADSVISWSRQTALWPETFGIACCAIEMKKSAGCARYDLDRFGVVFRPSPRQSDVMIVAGTVTQKMALAVKRIYDQMPEPKWVIAMGACAINRRHVSELRRAPGNRSTPSGRTLASAGCPPRPEALLEGLFRLSQQKIDTEKSFVAQKKELLAELQRAPGRNSAISAWLPQNFRPNSQYWANYRFNSSSASVKPLSSSKPPHFIHDACKFCKNELGYTYRLRHQRRG